MMVITPPHIHWHVHVCVNAGIFWTKTLGEPGVHGATVDGMHGIGVSTPIAAAVAEATTGLAGQVHIPKGIMFTIGAKSMMLAAGTLAIMTFRTPGAIASTLGAMPKVHISFAPQTT